MLLDYYNCEWLSDKEIKELYGLSPNAIIIERDAINIYSWKEPIKNKKEFVRAHKNEILEILEELKEEGKL